MQHDNAPAYGLWSLVIINSAVFIIFAFSFFKPNTARDWRSFSAFSAFLVALLDLMAVRRRVRAESVHDVRRNERGPGRTARQGPVRRAFA